MNIIVEYGLNTDLSKIVAWVIDYDFDLGKEMLRSMVRTLRNNDRLLSETLEELDESGNPNNILTFLIEELELGIPSRTYTLSNYPANKQ